jgi:signal transduction histidine kinase
VACGGHRPKSRRAIKVNAEEKPITGVSGTIQKLTRLLAAPTIEPGERAVRIQAVERDIVLPLRVLIICILTYYFFFSGWFVTPRVIPQNNPQVVPQAPGSRVPPHAIPQNSNQQLVPQSLGGRVPPHVITQNSAPALDDWIIQHGDIFKGCLLAYAALTVVVGVILIWSPQLNLKRVKTIVFLIGLLDAMLMAVLILLNRGFDSILYLVLPVIILHNALAIPVAFLQILLNLIVCVGFMVGGSLDQTYIAPWDLTDPRVEKPAERLIVLVAWSLCCYGIQVLFEKQKRAEAEATELAVRQERLHTAGRLAAEIAHNIKNPLGIITNAAFSLQRAVHDGEMAVDEQIQIIREEVEHADSIITELMGYAQLAEGKVERLEAAEELDNALHEIFPPAAKYRVEINRHYEPSLPFLLMQRRHLSSVLVNLLQNAREAMNGVGRIEASARYGTNDSVIIGIADNGPGIAPEKMDKIFEAHFTTRAKGTGLGLAIVKHNTEIYGGTVKVESELGKGTRFTLEFPARILMRLSK